MSAAIKPEDEFEFEIPENRKRGRPVGSVKGTYLRKNPKWVPKGWIPLYELMLLESCSGVPHKVIAEKYKYTAVQVANILNSDIAKAKRAALEQELTNRYLDGTAKEQADLIQAAKANIRFVLMDETGIIKQKAPMTLFDKSIKYLQLTGQLKNDEEGKGNTNNIFLGNDVARILADGLNKANDVSRMHMVPVVVEKSNLALSSPTSPKPAEK